jgi:hypothetical protein
VPGEPDLDRVLEAHVRFVVERWSGPVLEDVVREHAEAVLGWLGGVTLREVAPPPETAAALAAVADEVPVTEALEDLLADAVRAVRAALADREETVGDVVAAEEADVVVAVAARMEDARRDLLDVLTASEAYTELVGQIVYLGLKGYVLTENVLAKRIPGASSLVRLGQRGLSSAAPRLEAGVDRQLTAFVQSSIAETLQETRRYLDATLDEDRLRALGAEVWEVLAERSLASLVAAVDEPDADAVLGTGGPLGRRLRDSGLLGDLVEAVAGSLLERHGDRTVAALLDDLGVDTARVTTDVVALLRPAVERARESGLLEERVRAELEPFYAALPGLLAERPETPAAARRPARVPAQGSPRAPAKRAGKAPAKGDR